MHSQSSQQPLFAFIHRPFTHIPLLSHKECVIRWNSTSRAKEQGLISFFEHYITVHCMYVSSLPFTTASGTGAKASSRLSPRTCELHCHLPTRPGPWDFLRFVAVVFFLFPFDLLFVQILTAIVESFFSVFVFTSGLLVFVANRWGHGTNCTAVC